MQKINRKWIAMILVISLLTSFPVYAADADTEIPVETEAVRVSEVESLRETNSETYLMSDGTYQCVVYAEDKYYLDSNDTLQRIDNTIVLETASAEASLNAASVARYKNTANAFDVRFSGSGVPEISMAKDGGGVTFSPLTAAKGNTLQMNAVATPITVGAVNDCAALGQLTPTGSNTVTYKNAFANTDLVYVLENGALKEYIILRNSNAAGEFSFLFTLDGLTLETVDDNAYLTDSDGNAVFALSDLFAIDANGVLTEALSYSFTPVKGDDQIIVTVTLDESYLQAADRTFPVIIDPSITISSVQTADACVCSYYPNTNYKTAYQLRTGKDTDYGIRRSYIKFNIPDSVPIYGVQTATLEIERVSGSDPKVWAHRVTSSWDSSTITWNNKASYSSTDYSTQSGVQSNGTWCTMYVTNIVKSWINGASPNYGFVLMDGIESNTDHWTTFYSSDASSPHKPELNITYVYGCKPFVSTSSSAMNCQGYAFFTNNVPQLWTTSDVSYLYKSSTTTSMMLDLTEERVEEWLDQTYPGKWKKPDATTGLTSYQWLIAMRVGKQYVPNYGTTQIDYHFWYRTSSGVWANKHGTAGSAEQLPSTDVPETNSSSGWELWGVSPFYDSDIVYYIVTE